MILSMILHYSIGPKRLCRFMWVYHLGQESDSAQFSFEIEISRAALKTTFSGPVFSLLVSHTKVKTKYTHPLRFQLTERHSMNDSSRKIFTLRRLINCWPFYSPPLPFKYSLVRLVRFV